jgi:ankyrin repeat protein
MSTGNARELRNAMMGVFLMVTSMLASGDELTLAGRSAQEAFHDDGVVNLLRATRKNDAIATRRIVESGVNVNAVGKDGATPLIWMLGQQNLAGMKLLLDLGADPDQYVVGGVGPPVWLAAGGGKLEALRLLLESKANPNLAYGNESPLMMAISDAHMDCAELLLRYGADINYAGSLISALNAAMLHVRFDDAIWVLNHGYTHDLPMARRLLAATSPRPGQEALKAEALDIVDRMLAQKQMP